VAHSDGDVLLHAVIDALLGAAALGDIGAHFPPSDPKWKDADSKSLTRSVVDLVRAAGYAPVNLDCTVVTETPRLGPHRDAIRASLAGLLGMDLAEVSVKAKTKEGVDAVGEGRAIEARAVVLLERIGS
jgi:2-C-methyl-D-erythritol 2,4-cyclodiphosphate synthase